MYFEYRVSLAKMAGKKKPKPKLKQHTVKRKKLLRDINHGYGCKTLF